MVNCYAGYTVSERKLRKRARMDANNPLCHSEHSEESRGEKEEIHRFALNDKRPNTEEHPPAPLQRGEERSEGGCYPFGRGKSGAQRWGKRHRISAEGCKPDVTIVVHSHVYY